jgi:DNA-binding NarL/FixJ family response regulator
VTIRVLLADDQALLRGTFRLLIDHADDMTVVAEAADGEQAVGLTEVHRPDVVLMDIRMPHIDGIEATRRITANPDLVEVKMLVLTTYETDDLVIQALRAGASGFLGKGVEPHTLLEAIRTVGAGESLLSSVATTALISRFLAQPTSTGAASAHAELLASLTPREQEITTLVGLGLSNDQIADRLVISPTTAKTHVNRAMMKTDCRDRAQLVILAYESGLVRPGWAGA